MYSGSKADLIGKLAALPLNDYMRSNQLREMIHNEAGKDFLQDVLHFFRVKVKKAKRIFQRAESGFNTPAQGIQLFELSGRERICGEVRDYRFKEVVRNLKTHNPEQQTERLNILSSCFCCFFAKK